MAFRVDGEHVAAMEGDTLLTALLTNRAAVRQSEFDDRSRAGFCLMGACQDCWVWTTDGERLRSCSTYVIANMDILTGTPLERQWPGHE